MVERLFCAVETKDTGFVLGIILTGNPLGRHRVKISSPQRMAGLLLQWTGYVYGSQTSDIFPEGLHELYIAELFSSPELGGDPINRCVPLLDFIDLYHGGGKLMAMPMPCAPSIIHVSKIWRIRHLLASKFMHQRNLRRVSSHTSQSPPGFPGKSQDIHAEGASHGPHRYALVNYGLSRRYPSQNVSNETSRGCDRSGQEHKRGGQCDPLCTGIYYLGNLFRENFMTYKYNGFVERFSRIRDSLSTIKLCPTIAHKNDPRLFATSRHTRQLTRTQLYSTVSYHRGAPSKRDKSDYRHNRFAMVTIEGTSRDFPELLVCFGFTDLITFPKINPRRIFPSTPATSDDAFHNFRLQIMALKALSSRVLEGQRKTRGRRLVDVWPAVAGIQITNSAFDNLTPLIYAVRGLAFTSTCRAIHLSMTPVKELYQRLGPVGPILST
ncbi:hypothetical protein BJV78DRAFT_1159023 [Lactifluus subvellereus]|nr:hypothetical protein BJV78DRAFT_1159023 [Lactifluus subvellereus]